MGVQVRAATSADLPAVLALMRRYCEADGHAFDTEHVSKAVTGLIDEPSLGWLLVADNLGTVCGYAVLTWGYGIESGGIEALLDEIYAEPSGEGIGSTLLLAAVEAARERGAQTIFLETESANERARAFYQRRGFAIEESVWLRMALTD